MITLLLMVPSDPYSVLEEGQIHFRSSKPIINPSTGEQSDLILGDVLVNLFICHS